MATRQAVSQSVSQSVSRRWRCWSCTRVWEAFRADIVVGVVHAPPAVVLLVALVMADAAARCRRVQPLHDPREVLLYPARRVRHVHTCYIEPTPVGLSYNVSTIATISPRNFQ